MAFVSAVNGVYSRLYDNYVPSTQTGSNGSNSPTGSQNGTNGTNGSNNNQPPGGTQPSIQDQINALLADMDQHGVNAAKLARLHALQAQLAAEQQKDPPLTGDGSGVDNALLKLLSKSQDQLNKDKNKLQNDQNAQQNTQQQIDDINNELNNDNLTPAQRANLIKRLRALQAQLVQEQNAINGDKSAINHDQAVIDACKMILYSDQANADKDALNAAWQALQDAGVQLPWGGTLNEDQYSKLKPAKKAAYDKYLKALGKYIVDSAAANKYYADLQKMASHPNTADDATNAIDEVNNAVYPFGIYYNYVDAIDPSKADKNADDANKAAQYWNTVNDYFNALIADHNANAKLAADQAQLDALRKKYGRIIDANQDDTIPNDYNALSQADVNLQQAELNLSYLQQTLIDQASPGLKRELGIALAQQNLNDAQANLDAAKAALAELEKQHASPGQIRLAEQAVQEAQEQLDAAKAQLAEAQKGNWQAVTQFSDQDLQNAIAKVQANHQGEVIFDGLNTSDLINQYGWEFKVNQEIALIQSAPELYLTPEEQQLWNNGKNSQIDISTLALIKLLGLSIDNETDAKIALKDPLAFITMKLGKVSITTEKGQIQITIDGKPIDVKSDPTLWLAVKTNDPYTILQALMGKNPTTKASYININKNTQAHVQNLILGTVAARLDYVKTQMQKYMGGADPTQQQQKDAAHVLGLALQFSFTPQERAQIWAEAGAPYFTPAFFEKQFEKMTGKVDYNVTDPDSSGLAMDKIGKYLKGLLDSSPGSYELAEVILDAIKSGYNRSWLLQVNTAGAPGHQEGVNFYEALSEAVETALNDPNGDSNLASEWAQWLTAQDGRGDSIMLHIGDFAVHKAIMDGWGALSKAVDGIYQTSNSYTAKRFDTDFNYATNDYKNAQNYLNVTNQYNNFNAKNDVPAFFNQFKDNPYIDHAIQLGSGPNAVDDTQLADIIGEALGFMPDANAADDAMHHNYKKDWYAEGTPQRAVIDLIIGWIHKEGGATPQIKILPMVYAAQGGGVQYGALFEVTTKSGQTVIIDGSAAEQDVVVQNDVTGTPSWHYSSNMDGQQWSYSSLQDYQENNSYSRDGTIYLPQDGFLPGDTAGPVTKTGYGRYGTYTYTVQPNHTGGPGYIQYQAHTWGWKDTVNFVRDVAAPFIAMGVTIATGGAGAPLMIALLAGTMAGFYAFELTDFAENAVTLAQGDKLNNQQISLLTPLTNNFFQGGVTSQEWGQATVDAISDLINSAGASAGALASGAASTSWAASESPLFAARFGAKLVTVSADEAEAGLETSLAQMLTQKGGLLLAEEDAPPQVLNALAKFRPLLTEDGTFNGLLVAGEEASPRVLQAVAEFNMKHTTNALLRRLFINPLSSAAGFTAGQLFTQPAGYLVTGINVAYQESQGQISYEQGQKVMDSAFNSMLFNLGTAPVAGAFGGFFANTIGAQAAANLFINTALTEGNEFFQGWRQDGLQGALDAIRRNLPQDLAQILLNTGLGVAMHAGGEYFARPRLSAQATPVPLSPDSTTGPKLLTVDGQSIPLTINSQDVTAHLPSYVKDGLQIYVASIQMPGEPLQPWHSWKALERNGEWYVVNRVSGASGQPGTFEVNESARTIKLTVDGEPVTARVEGYGTMPSLADIWEPGAPDQGQPYILYNDGGRYVIRLRSDPSSRTMMLMVDGALQKVRVEGYGTMPALTDIQMPGAADQGQPYVMFQDGARYTVRLRSDPSSRTIMLMVDGALQKVRVEGYGTMPALTDIQMPGATDQGQPYVLFQYGGRYTVRLKSDPSSRTIMLTVDGQLVRVRVAGYGTMPAPSDIRMPGATDTGQPYVLTLDNGRYVAQERTVPYDIVRAAIEQRAYEISQQGPEADWFQARQEIIAQLTKGTLTPGNLHDMIEQRAYQIWQQRQDAQANWLQAEKEITAQIDAGQFQQQPASTSQPVTAAKPIKWNFKDWPTHGVPPPRKFWLEFWKKVLFLGLNPPGHSYRPEDYDALVQKLVDSGELQLNGQIVTGKNGGQYPLSYAAFKADDHTVLLAWLPETPGDTDIHFHTLTFAQTFSAEGHPGRVDNLIRRIPFLPSGLFGKDRVSNFVFNVAKMIVPGSETSLGPVPYYCGVFQGHYTNHEIQTILMKNLMQLDKRTVSDMQNLPYEPLDPKKGDTRNKYAFRSIKVNDKYTWRDLQDALPWPADGSQFVQDPNNPANSTLPADLRYEALHKLELRARVHGTCTALDFSGNGPDAVEAFKELLKEYPLQFAHFGELTFHKEHVEVQRGPTDMEEFRKLLIWLKEQGIGKILVVIHNDWSRVGTDPNNKRPLTVMGAYENLVEAVKFWTDPSLRDDVTGELLVQPVFAHTGIGRTSRGSDVQTPELKFEYYDKDLNYRTVTRGFSDHIDVMRFLKEMIPNLMFDFSWNDVTMNYLHSPVLAEKFIDWVLEENPKLPKEQWNRFSIMIGSDAVRPVYLEQKNQGINTFLPILAELARRGPAGEEAVLNLVVRNYARLLDDAYKVQMTWWEKQIKDRTSGFDEQKYNAAKAEFVILQLIRNGLRDDQGNLVLGPDGKTPVFIGSRAYLEQKWQIWMTKVQDKGEVDPAELGNPGGFVSIHVDTPHPEEQDPPPVPLAKPVWDKNLLHWPKYAADSVVTSWHNGWVKRGELTAGGAKNNPGYIQDPITQEAVTKLRNCSLALAAAALGVTAADWGLAAANPFIARLLSETGYVARVAGFLARDTWNENVRVFREKLTEEGHLTREALDEFVSPITRSAGQKDFSDRQMLDVRTVTEQFWNDYKKFWEQPVDTGPDAPKINAARGQAILAAVGEFTSKLASILNVDPASLSPFSSTAPWGIALRAVILLTYIENVGASLPVVFLHSIKGGDPISLAASFLSFASTSGFAAANLFGGALTLEALAGGISGRNIEGHPWFQQMQRALQWAYTIDGVVWALGQGAQTLADIFMNHKPITSLVDLVEFAGIVAWTYAANRNRVNADAVVTGSPQPHTYEQWKTFVIMFVGIAVSQIFKAVIENGALNGPDGAVEAWWSDFMKWVQSIGHQQTPKGTPVPTIKVTPTATPAYTPTTTPTQTPTLAPKYPGRYPGHVQ